ncbi:MAG: hypothetical protein ACREHD_28235 [Pirellulales bacterium]
MHHRFAYVLGTWLSGACLLTGFSGCSKTEVQSEVETSSTAGDANDTASESQTARVDSPADREAAAQVVRDFLQAIKSGDETVSNDLLTPLARQKTAELDMAVAPMGSESARFEVGAVELPQEGEGELAHVASTWTDIDDDGREHTDEILWVLRREDEGWRIGGMATKVFEDQPALLLDFEDPVDMRRKQQLAEAELERRAREAVERPGADAAKEDDASEESAVPVADKRHSNARSQGTRNK